MLTTMEEDAELCTKTGDQHADDQSRYRVDSTTLILGRCLQLLCLRLRETGVLRLGEARLATSLQPPVGSLTA